MPAKRMNAAVGSTLKVIGKSSAMVSAGPRPGRTPIAVPSVVPTRHHRRFIGVSATAKPLRSCEKASMSTALHADHAFYRALEKARTDVDAERRGEAARHADEQDGRSDGESRRADQDDVEHQPGSDPEERCSVRRDDFLLLGLPAALPGIDEKEDAEQSQSSSRHQRNDGRPDLGVEG